MSDERGANEARSPSKWRSASTCRMVSGWWGSCGCGINSKMGWENSESKHFGHACFMSCSLLYCSRNSSVEYVPESSFHKRNGKQSRSKTKRLHTSPMSMIHPMNASFLMLTRPVSENPFILATYAFSILVPNRQSTFSRKVSAVLGHIRDSRGIRIRIHLQSTVVNTQRFCPLLGHNEKGSVRW